MNIPLSVSENPNISFDVGESTIADRNWKLIATASFDVSTTSTTEESVGSIRGIKDRENKIIYVKIRDAAGARDGYHYGSDNYFINHTFSRGANNNESRVSWQLTGTYFNGQRYTGTSGCGVYAPSIDPGNLSVRIYSRYNRFSSGIIDGTFTVEIYEYDMSGLFET